MGIFKINVAYTIIIYVTLGQLFSLTNQSSISSSIGYLCVARVCIQMSKEA